MKFLRHHLALSVAALGIAFSAQPAEARFLQSDPIGYKDQMNLYGYVGNDPLNATDPDGKCLVPGTPLGGLCGAIIGGVIGGGLNALGQAFSGKPFNTGDFLQSTTSGAITGGILGAFPLAALESGGVGALSGGATTALKDMLTNDKGDFAPDGKIDVPDVVLGAVGGGVGAGVGGRIGENALRVLNGPTAKGVGNAIGGIIGEATGNEARKGADQIPGALRNGTDWLTNQIDREKGNFPDPRFNCPDHNCPPVS